MRQCAYSISIKNNSISVAARSRKLVYNSSDKPSLMCNIAEPPIVQEAELEKLNTAYRAWLHKGIGNFYPNILHSDELYEREDSAESPGSRPRAATMNFSGPCSKALTRDIGKQTDCGFY